jgi:hypothetical protein
VSRSRVVARSIGAVGVVAVLVISAGGAVGASQAGTASAKPQLRLGKPKPGTPGQFNQVVAVPGSTDAWAVGQNPDESALFLERWHAGKLKRVNPGMGAGGDVNGVAAGSSKLAWAIGSTNPDGSVNPDMARLTVWHGGKRFAAVTLPGLSASAAYVRIAASSAKNAWIVGELETAASPNTQVAEHWNGKTWKAYPVPSSLEDWTALSTSSATNAWAVASGMLVHWNGKTWTVKGTAPAGAALRSIATSSAKHAVAVGARTTSKSQFTFIMRFNGRKWTTVHSPNPAIGSQLQSVTMHGSAAWAVGYGSSKDVQFTGFEPFVLHSTGGKWKREKFPGGYGGYLFGVSAQSAKRVYAVGGEGYDGTFQTSFATFNGHTWTAQKAKP